jgi:adenylate cyclase
LQFTRSKQLLIGSIILAATLTTISLQSLGLFSRIESASFDHRVSLFRSDQRIHEDVVVILIDEESLQSMSNELGRWPWPRAAYRDLLDFFALAGAQAFAFDILFAEQQDADKNNDSDRVLVEATRRAGNTVHAMQLLHLAQTNKKRSLPEEFKRLHALESSNFVGPYYDDYLLPFDALYKASRDIGFLEVSPDRDGVYRRIRLFDQFNHNQVFPSLASALVLPLVGDINSITSDQDKVEMGDLKIPLDGDGNYLINPYGYLVAYSAAQVFTAMKQIRAGENENLVLDPKKFTGKLVLLGASAIGLLDVKATALASKEAGVFLHAYTVSNLLQQDFLLLQPFILSLAIIFLLCCVTIIPIVIMPRLLVASLFPVTAAITYLIVAYGAFAFNQVYPVTPVIFAIALSLLLAYSLRTHYEKYSRQEPRIMPGQYVSTNVLKTVKDSNEDLHAGPGSEESLSILFSDIRGFTNISESLEPGQVVELLNIYFSEMAEIIIEHNGTLDKFIGDAIMAFWGAPVRTFDHATQAVECAIDMRQRLGFVNERLLSKSYPEIDIGIGIHSGSVILGNIGSDKKLDYTVIGKNVDLASRLEGLTRIYDCPLIISEDTRELIPSSIPCMLVDMVRIKGKQCPIRLYVPAELFRVENKLSISALELQEKTEHAFNFYLKRDWQEAAKTYGQIGSCVLSSLYQQRCRQYKSVQPDDEWDGVYTFAGK